MENNNHDDFDGFMVNVFFDIEWLWGCLKKGLT